MSLDREIIDEVSKNPTYGVLRWYSWKPPAFSLGYGQNPENIFKNTSEITYVKRPTGGSLLYHGGDISYSFTIPRKNPLGIDCSCDLYNFISSAWIEGFKKLGIPVEMPVNVPKAKDVPRDIRNLCLAFNSPGDLLLNGKKIGGSAQRRLRNVWHQQGFIMLESIEIPDCFQDSKMIQSIKSNSTDLKSSGFKIDYLKISETFTELLRNKIT